MLKANLKNYVLSTASQWLYIAAHAINKISWAIFLSLCTNLLFCVIPTY